jgi:DNA-binding response OmpR family regulator
MRVLVVDDHEELAQIVATGLRREGMAVDVALDGPAALERASIYGYDVIVLDRDLPGVHGDRVCETLVAQGGAGTRTDAHRLRRDRGAGGRSRFGGR